MTNQSEPAKDKKSNANIIVIIVVILAILFFVSYQITKPKSPTAKLENTQIQTETITQAAEEESENVDQPAPETTESATTDQITDKTVNDEDLKSIQTFLENWKIAWQKSADVKGNLKKYFSFYADDFKTAKLSKDAWQRSKSIRNRGKSWIEVWFTNIDISKDDNGNFIAKFKQEYSSSNYSDKSTKKLTLRKTDDSWEIIKEETL